MTRAPWSSARIKVIRRVTQPELRTNARCKQELKPFPENVRPIPLEPFSLPVEVRNLIEHGNIKGRQRSDNGDEQQEAKPFPGPEDEGEDVERNFPVPVEIRNIIHQV